MGPKIAYTCDLVLSVSLGIVAGCGGPLLVVASVRVLASGGLLGQWWSSGQWWQLASSSGGSGGGIGGLAGQW